MNAGLEGPMAEICPGWEPGHHKEGEGQIHLDEQMQEYCTNEYIKLAIFTSAIMGIIQILAMVLRSGMDDRSVWFVAELPSSQCGFAARWASW
eukprot:g4067.t1